MELWRYRYAVYLMLRVVGIIIFIVNWSACIYFAIDFYFYNQKGYYYTTGQIWATQSIEGLNQNNDYDIFSQFPWYIWYNYAMYLAVQTSSGVGYGDITPRNPIEVLFINVSILMTPVFFSFFINSIWEIVGEIQKKSIDYENNMKNLKGFLRDMDLPVEMDKKIRDYYHEVWQNDQ